MRITSVELQSIIRAINNHLTLTQAQLRLYGSRVRDEARGGDIDLLLVVSNETQYQAFIQSKVSLLAEMKTLLGDQKIDFTAVKRDKITEDPFIHLIFDGSVIIHQWP